MNALLDNKKAVVALTVLVLGFFIYSAVVGPKTAPPTGGAVSPGEDLVKVAEKLSTINFDQNLFKTSGYKSLIDWSPVVPAQPTGRPNPFEVIGRD